MHEAGPVPQAPPMCVHLRCKGMFIRGELDRDSPLRGDTAVWWCARTSHVIGPDDDVVRRDLCVPGRGCYDGPAPPRV